MTYLEDYMQCKDLTELKVHLTNDINTAMILFGNNPDRLKKIADAAEKVIEQKEWEDLI